jgi:hypothetical protein
VTLLRGRRRSNLLNLLLSFQSSVQMKTVHAQRGHRMPVASSHALDTLARALVASPSSRCLRHRSSPSLKAIEDVQVGDLVWARESTAEAAVRRPVVQLFRRRDRSVLQILYRRGVGTERRVIATLDHPFWVQGQGWVAARDLARGDALQCIDGAADRTAIVTGINELGTTDVFNFEVDGAHNYFVGPDGLLAHNESTLPHQPARVPPSAAHGSAWGLRWETPDTYMEGRQKASLPDRSPLETTHLRELGTHEEDMGASFRFFVLDEAAGRGARVSKPYALRREGGDLTPHERGHLLWDSMGFMKYHGKGRTTDGMPYFDVEMHRGFVHMDRVANLPAHVESAMQDFTRAFDGFMKRHTGEAYGDFQWGVDETGQVAVIDPPRIMSDETLRRLQENFRKDLAPWVSSNGRIKLPNIGMAPRISTEYSN